VRVRLGGKELVVVSSLSYEDVELPGVSRDRRRIFLPRPRSLSQSPAAPVAGRPSKSFADPGGFSATSRPPDTAVGPYSRVPRRLQRLIWRSQVAVSAESTDDKRRLFIRNYVVPASCLEKLAPEMTLYTQSLGTMDFSTGRGPTLTPVSEKAPPPTVIVFA